MQSTGHSSTHALSLTPMHGSAMTYVIRTFLLAHLPLRQSSYPLRLSQLDGDEVDEHDACIVAERATDLDRPDQPLVAEIDLGLEALVVLADDLVSGSHYPFAVQLERLSDRIGNVDHRREPLA